jgi:hypothetical protein
MMTRLEELCLTSGWGVRQPDVKRGITRRLKELRDVQQSWLCAKLSARECAASNIDRAQRHRCHAGRGHHGPRKQPHTARRILARLIEKHQPEELSYSRIVRAPGLVVLVLSLGDWPLKVTGNDGKTGGTVV